MNESLVSERLRQASGTSSGLSRRPRMPPNPSVQRTACGGR